MTSSWLCLSALPDKNDTVIIPIENRWKAYTKATKTKNCHDTDFVTDDGSSVCYKDNPRCDDEVDIMKTYYLATQT